MSVGAIITISPDRRVVKRQPVWPWPKPEVYPRMLPQGSIQLFFPCSYLRFNFGDRIYENLAD